MSDWKYDAYKRYVAASKKRVYSRLCARCGQPYTTPHERVDHCSSECLAKDTRAARAAMGGTVSDAATERAKANYRVIYADARRGLGLPTAIHNLPSPVLLVDEGQEIDPELRPRDCAFCGKPFGCLNPNTRYCSRACSEKQRKAVYNAKYRECKGLLPQAAETSERACSECGSAFKPKRSVDKTCSFICQLARKARMRKERIEQERRQTDGGAAG